MDFSSIVLQQDDKDVSRKAYNMRKTIVQCQESFSVIERCPQPVIAAIHSACVGGGVDMICSCDIRWCTSDAWFQIKVKQRLIDFQHQRDIDVFRANKKFCFLIFFVIVMINTL